VQAGAGIVHDSIPEREWDETENKARALLTAIGRVHSANGREIARQPEAKDAPRDASRISTRV
jgi:chorismate binding enzyme